MKTKIGLLGLIASVLFISCNNDNSSQSSTPMTADDLTTTAKIDEMSNDVSNIAENQFMQQSGMTGKGASKVESNLPSCATVTTTATSTTWTRTIDFGTAGCAMPNGNILKGQIIVSGSVNYNEPSYTINYSLVNFYHNDISIQANKTIVRTKEATANLATIHPVHTMNMDMTVTDSSGEVRNVTGTRIREMVQGFDTPALSDDAFLISGSQSITSPKGTITTTITSPLHIDMNCLHISQGTVVHTKNKKTATLDYGNGTCDNIATITINGVVKTIKLGKN